MKINAAEIFLKFLQYKPRDDVICFKRNCKGRRVRIEMQMYQRRKLSLLLQQPSWEFTVRSSGRPDIWKRIEQTFSARRMISVSGREVIDLSMSTLRSTKCIDWLSNF
jgi:hypothetical protein